MCGFREGKLSSGLHVYTVLEWKLRMFHLRLSSLDTHTNTHLDSQHTRTRTCTSCQGGEGQESRLPSHAVGKSSPDQVTPVRAARVCGERGHVSEVRALSDTSCLERT